MATPAKGAVLPRGFVVGLRPRRRGSVGGSRVEARTAKPTSRHQLCPLAGPELGDGVPSSGNRGECCASRSSWRECLRRSESGPRGSTAGLAPPVNDVLRSVAARGGFDIPYGCHFRSLFAECRVEASLRSGSRFTLRPGRIAIREERNLDGCVPNGYRERVLAAGVIRQTGGACS